MKKSMLMFFLLTLSGVGHSYEDYRREIVEHVLEPCVDATIDTNAIESEESYHKLKAFILSEIREKNVERMNEVLQGVRWRNRMEYYRQTAAICIETVNNAK